MTAVTNDKPAVDDDVIIAFVEESTARSGVPLHVEDPETLARIGRVLGRSEEVSDVESVTS